MGFEPTTASLEGWNSTTELRPPSFFLSVHTVSKTNQRLSCLSGSPSHKLAGTSEAIKQTCGLYPVAKNHVIGSGSSKLNQNTGGFYPAHSILKFAGPRKRGLVGRQGFEPWKT